MKTLEDVLKDHKFIAKSKRVFRKRRIYVDDLPDDMTKAGHKAYRELISLIYDLAKLLGGASSSHLHRIVDELDFITTQNY